MGSVRKILSHIKGVILWPVMLIRKTKSKRKMIGKNLIQMVNDLENKYALPRKKTEKYLINKKHEIDEYWQEQGLSESKLNDESTNVRFKTSEPFNKDSQVYNGIDLSQWYEIPTFINKDICKWGFSDMTDAMHTKSLHKRIASRKIDYNSRAVRMFNKNLVDMTWNLNKTEITDDEFIYKALGTKGTAGQFSKTSKMEDRWKNKTDKEMFEVWRKLNSRIIDAVACTNNLPEKFVSYMLYRKREILPKDEDGEVKITRLMNSPNLMVRVPDSVVFGKMNEAIINKRNCRIANVGINIFEEMKLIITYDPTKYIIEWDISDFDGGQCAMQLVGNCKARLEYGIRTQQSINELVYLVKRYERHIHKVVRSTSGIEYEVIGQQASGDITTSDHNSEKSAAFVVMVIDKINEKLNHHKIFREGKRVNSVGRNIVRIGDEASATTHGDDGNLQIIKEIVEDNDFGLMDIIKNTAESIGWKIKAEEFKLHRSLQDGKNTFLSHGVTIRQLQINDHRIKLGLITRETERLNNKWNYSAELDDYKTKENRMKLTGKMISFMIASLGNPEIMLASALMIMKLRSTHKTTIMQYSWMGVSSGTFENLNAESIIKLQLPVDFDEEVRQVKIKINRNEKNAIREVKKKMEEEIDWLWAIRNIKKPKIKVDIIDENDNLSVTNVIEIIKKYYVEMEKHSLISKLTSDERWWMQESKTFERPKIIEGKIITCEHTNKDNFIKKSNCKYNIKVMCDECYENRREKKYDAIHVAIIR
jgi:hypothetical protein